MRAVGYVRVSTEDQAKEGVSLAAQEEKVRAYCLVKDWDLVDVIRDEGYSGKNLARPGVQELMGLVRQHRVEAVVVYKLDRLTRSVVDLNQLVELFEKHGVALVSLQESLDATTATGRLMMNLLASVSQWEREVIGERTRGAMAHLRASRKRYCRPVFGFTDLDGKLVEDHRDAEALQLLLKWREQGKSYAEMAELLTRAGFPTKRGGRWQANTVRRILLRAGKEAVAVG
jgi:DNA invertase Pin-like site-specific DNA recombinase